GRRGGGRGRPRALRRHRALRPRDLARRRGGDGARLRHPRPRAGGRPPPRGAAPPAAPPGSPRLRGAPRGGAAAAPAPPGRAPRVGGPPRPAGLRGAPPGVGRVSALAALAQAAAFEDATTFRWLDERIPLDVAG